MTSITLNKIVTDGKKALCAKHAPKCITSKCPLARYFCYDLSVMQLVMNSNPVAKKEIKKICKEAVKNEI